MKPFHACAAAVAMLALAATASGADLPAQTGRWITESGNLEVDIAPCGDALCGTVVRVLANRSMSPAGGEMQPADTRSPLGMRVLTDFRPAEGAEWRGRIYNREDGNTYDCLMELLDSDHLKIRGYKGLPLFGKTQVWQRAEGGTQ
jgi:uncharacterized protein (DUF2147 family)